MYTEAIDVWDGYYFEWERLHKRASEASEGRAYPTGARRGEVGALRIGAAKRGLGETSEPLPLRFSSLVLSREGVLGERRNVPLQLSPGLACKAGAPRRDKIKKNKPAIAGSLNIRRILSYRYRSTDILDK